MRFRIAKTELTDEAGKILPAVAVSHHVLEADTVDEAIRHFVGADHAQVMGDVLKFPGFQAVVTVRRASHVYTLELNPVSDRIPRRP